MAPEAVTPFRTPTPWETYRPYIVGVAILVAAQTLLIAAPDTVVAVTERLPFPHHRLRLSSFDALRQKPGIA